MDTFNRTTIGTTMLLMAAAIVVLTFVFRGPLWRANLGSAQQLRETAGDAKETLSRRIAASPFSTTSLTTTDQTSAHAAAAASDRPVADKPSASATNKQPAQQAAPTTSSTSERSSQPLSVYNDADPWAATKCVYVLNLYERTKVVNGCDVPVAVVVPPNRPIVLPAPAQRPVTLEEQTVDGSGQHRACFIASSEVRTLINAPMEERSTPQWRARFESARASDNCLLRLQH